ncbi:class B sortase [Candidatus Saccharibacteria bacterium]|nr:class B sortase [Candidatus Saccharibacteria bacterium]
MRISRTRSRIKIGISCLVALACVIGIGFSGYKIVEWLRDSHETKAASVEIEEVAAVTESEDSDNTEVVEQEEEPPKESLYWQYIHTNLLDVNFSELKKLNSETIGWIRVGGTNINYPFVQTSNNDFYLKHSFDKSYNSAGWVFADFRNHIDGTDRNMIVYAHGRYDTTMFGSLRNILTSGWLNNPSNYIVRTSNESENALWQVFSTYRIETTNDYIQTSFRSDEDFGRFVNMLKDRSAHDFNTTVSGTDHILTLSTCYSKTERVVLHAKLIKRERR